MLGDTFLLSILHDEVQMAISWVVPSHYLTHT